MKRRFIKQTIKKSTVKLINKSNNYKKYNNIMNKYTKKINKNQKNYFNKSQNKIDESFNQQKV